MNQTWNLIYMDGYVNIPKEEPSHYQTKVRIYASPDQTMLEIQGNVSGIWTWEGWRAWIIRISDLEAKRPKFYSTYPEHIEGVYEAILETGWEATHADMPLEIWRFIQEKINGY